MHPPPALLHRPPSAPLVAPLPPRTARPPPGHPPHTARAPAACRRHPRFDLTKEEALDLAQRAIFAATYRDAYSGGTVRVYHIDEKGWARVTEADSMELYFKFKEEKASADATMAAA